MRFIMFVLMQVAVLLVVGIVGSILMAVFGIRINTSSYIGLFVVCAVMGCVGSIISLFMSKTMCIHAYGVQLIQGQPQNRAEEFLLREVSMLAQRAGIKMPQVGIYNSPDPNAFATGASKDDALVAVSSGLLNNMSAQEIRGVLGHEISHINNGDMVTMTLLQGVLNTFVYFLSFIVAQAVTLGRNSDSESSSAGNTAMFYVVKMLLEVVFGIGATLIAMWFSRYREYRADASSAQLTGSPYDMIAALQALQRLSNVEVRDHGQFNAFQISSGSSLASLFSTHPSLESRIQALQQQTYNRQKLKFRNNMKLKLRKNIKISLFKNQ